MGILNRPRTADEPPVGNPGPPPSAHGWLAEVRVLDLSRGVAGGFCAKLLAEYGASVTRLAVQVPGVADRRGGGEPRKADDSGPAAWEAWLHGEKRPAPPGTDWREAVAEADLVIEDWRPMERAVLSWDARLSALPRPPIDVALSDLGAAEPLSAGRPSAGPASAGPPSAGAGAELLLQAWSGHLAPGTGPADPPRALPGRNAAQLGGLFAAVGALLALRVPVRPGEPPAPRRVRHTVVHGLATLRQFALETVQAGRPAEPSRAEALLPCRDGWVVAAIPESAPPELLAGLTGDAAFHDDPALAAAIRREASRAPLVERLGLWLAGQSRDAAVARAQSFQLPFGRVRGMAELAAEPGRLAGPPIRVTRPAAAAPASAPREAQAGPATPLAGLRVIELSAAWAGPMVGRLLAEYGAEVVRVEWQPQGGTAPPPAAALRRAAQHRGKASLALNGATASARDLLRRLAGTADVLVENFRPGVLESWGCGYAALSEGNPRLLLLSLSGFGRAGPGGPDGAVSGGWRALGSTVEGEAGWAALLGGPEGPPRTLAEPLSDPVAALNGLVALLAGLHQRERSGQGAHIDLSQRDAALRQIAAALLDAASGRPPGQDGPHTRGPGVAPHGVYRCAGRDPWIAISVDNSAPWGRLCALAGWQDWAEDAALAAGPGRLARREEIDRRLATWCAARQRGAALAALQAAGVDAAPVLGPGELTGTPGLRGCAAWVRVTHPEAGPLSHARTPLEIDGVVPRHGPASAYGADTRRVLRDWLGLPDTEIEALLRTETVAGPDQGRASVAG